ncbi:hypothetical protein ACU4GD_10325 [Cupriavidus basilensis]
MRPSMRWCGPPPSARYRKLFLATVTQADQGVDFDFLRAAQTNETVPRQS